MVLVGVGQDDDVQAPVPRRDPLVERDEDPVRVRSAIDEHPGAGPRLEEDGVALPDVQHGDPGCASGRLADGRPAERDDDRPGDERSPGRAGVMRTRGRARADVARTVGTLPSGAPTSQPAERARSGDEPRRPQAPPRGAPPRAAA